MSRMFNAPPDDPNVVDAEFVEEEQPSESAIAVVPPGALEAAIRAESDMQIATAHRFPRPENKIIRQRIISDCSEVEVAESCIYTLKRKDKSGKEKLIEGPSVRLAEVCVYHYGNTRTASWITENDGKKIKSRGFCWDLERNNQQSVEVSRRITDKYGHTFSEDMQIVTANAANSISYRNAVFKVIPVGIWMPALQAIKKVAVGEEKTLTAKRDEVLKRYAGMGVSKADVVALLGKQSIESINLEDLAQLVGLANAIKEGEITVKEAFQPAAEGEPQEGSQIQKLRETLRARREAKREKGK